MFDLLESVLSEAKGWAELRYHHRVMSTVAVRKGELEQSSSMRVSGVGIRVLKDGAFGFSSTSEVSESEVLKALGDAEKAAEISARNKKSKVESLDERGLTQGTFQAATDDPLADHDLEEKLKLVMDTERRVRESSTSIQSAYSAYSEITDEKYILTSDGARVHVLDAKPDFRAVAVAGKNGDSTMAMESTGVTGGWSDLFQKRSPEEMADVAAQRAVDLLSAKHPEGRRATVVLDPGLVGVLSHEAIGHTVEADFVLSGSIAKGKIAKKVASELVTLVDSGPSQIKPHAAGELLVDDEGVKTGKTILIEHGVLRSYLHNRETAKLFGVFPTGNARAFEYSNEPIIRMRNTYIEPGESSRDELIAEVEDGYLLKGLMGGGQADANAEFMFGVGEAYRIRDGKVAELVRGVTISGNAFEVLKSVDGVGKEFEWNLGAGYCGKGQRAKVDAGGPWLRCQVIIGGRQV